MQIVSTENRIWHFMQIVSTGDNLHEMSNPVFWEQEEKYLNMPSAENFTQCYVIGKVKCQISLLIRVI